MSLWTASAWSFLLKDVQLILKADAAVVLFNFDIAQDSKVWPASVNLYKLVSAIFRKSKELQRLKELYFCLHSAYSSAVPVFVQAL